MQIRRLVPLLHVNRIEDSLPFWCEKLGFEPAMQIQGSDGLDLALLVRDETQVMLQSAASLQRDTPQLAGHPAPGAGLLYLEVSELQSWIELLGDTEVVVPLRRASYGAQEIAVRDPAGYTVVLAEFA